LYTLQGIYGAVICYSFGKDFVDKNRRGKKNAKKKGLRRFYDAFENKNYRVILLAGFHGFTKGIEAFYRFTSTPFPFIGDDLLVTFLCTLNGWIFFGIQAPWCLEQLLSFMTSNARFGGAEGKKMGEQAKYQKKIFNIQRVFAIINFWGFMFMTYFVEDQGEQIIMAALYMAGCGVMAFFMMVSVGYTSATVMR